MDPEMDPQRGGRRGVSASFPYRTALGVWINDLRNSALPHEEWPCVRLDDRAEKDIGDAMAFAARNGFNRLSLFGLLTAGSWDPRIARTVDKERRRRVNAILGEARRCGIDILYGLGVYSWGFDRIIESDPAVQGTNPHAMCASRDASRRWMRSIVDYLLDEFDFPGFHLEASDQGRCSCERCQREGNAAYYSRINAETAAYIRAKKPDATLMVNMCGYLPWGDRIPRGDWASMRQMGEHLDFLIDAGHLDFYIDPADRRAFIRGLPCAFGTSGGVWVYPPQRWNRLRWFIPHTQHTGEHLAQLHREGARAVELYLGPCLNPGVEVNIAFSGRKMLDVGRRDEDLLRDVLRDLYEPETERATNALTDVFKRAEEAFFRCYDYRREPDPAVGGQILLTRILGRSPDPPLYLENKMSDAARAVYGRTMASLLPRVERLAPDVGRAGRVRLGRITQCIRSAVNDCRGKSE
jgi:hypothetical protein